MSIACFSILFLLKSLFLREIEVSIVNENSNTLDILPQSKHFGEWLLFIYLPELETRETYDIVIFRPRIGRQQSSQYKKNVKRDYFDFDIINFI